MRRTTMISGIDRLIAALDSTGLAELLAAAATARPGSAPKKPPAAEILRRFHEFVSSSGGFGAEEKAVLEAFELDPLLDTATWLAFVTDDAQGLALQRNLGFKFRSFRAYAPKFATMIGGPGQKAFAKPPKGQETLTLILPVEESEFSSSHRVVTALTGIEKLFTCCAQLAGKPDSELKLLGCDSGQDLSFDLLGASDIIEPLREILTTIWDRVVLHRELPEDERHRIVVDTLPIHLVIVKRGEEGSLDREAAERLRRQVASGARTFIEAGCMLAEFENTEHGGPRVLMKPSKRLIEGPIDSEPTRPKSSSKKSGRKEPEIEISVEA